MCCLAFHLSIAEVQVTIEINRCNVWMDVWRDDDLHTRLDKVEITWMVSAQTDLQGPVVGSRVSQSTCFGFSFFWRAAGAAELQQFARGIFSMRRKCALLDKWARN
jgi:hypothetical protein